MPVHFKGRSEYDSHYKWMESYRSRSFTPSLEQAADPAGCASIELGLVSEPPMQTKKRTQGPSTTLSVNYYEGTQDKVPDYALLGANDKFVPNIKYKYKSTSNGRDASPPKQQKLSKTQARQEKKKENIRPTKTEVAPAPVVNTEMYTQPPTPLAPRKEKHEHVSQDIAKSKDYSLENMNKQESITKAELKDKAILRQEESKAHKKALENNEHEMERRRIFERKDKINRAEDKISRADKAEPKANKAEPKYKTFKKPPVPSRPITDDNKNNNNMNEFVQTNMDKGIADSAPEAPTEYAMKYKAGVAPPRPRKKFSEYQKQFTWKDGGKSSPLLDAEQVIYKSNINISPTKKDVIPKVSEYKTQFKEWKYKPVPEEQRPDKPKKRSKVRRSKSMGALSPDKMRAAGSSPVVSPDNKRLTKEYDQQDTGDEEEPVPKITHGKMKRAKSEYDNNFRPPWSYDYVKGAWRGANPPHLSSQIAKPEEKVPALTSWFAEVIELRRKAAEYRKRAQGTHFSREHVVQLMAKQAEMWDAVSSRSGTSTLSALSLESGASARARKIEQNRVEEEDIEYDEESVSDRATMATEDDHHGSNKDFGDNSNYNCRKEKFTSKFGKTRVVEKGTQGRRRRSKQESSKNRSVDKGQQTYQIRSKDKKTKKFAWTEEEPMSPGSPTVDDVDEFDDDDDDGRVPTPILRAEKTKARHHLDLTTPAIGGAILTSPPPVRKQRKSRSPVSRSWPGPKQEIDEDSDDTLILEPPGCAKTAPPFLDVRKGNIAATPTYGMPSRDSHFLRDDEGSVDQPMATKFVHSPIKVPIIDTSDDSPPPKPTRSSKLRNPKFRALDVPGTLQEGYGQTYNKPAQNLVWSIDGGMPIPRRDPDDDVLSISARSVASSCSMASEVLERARKRKDEFWGKNGIASR